MAEGAGSCVIKALAVDDYGFGLECLAAGPLSHFNPACFFDKIQKGVILLIKLF
jgi:hypothetical protein